MNLLSWILLIVVVAWFIGALVYLARRRGSCGCGDKKSGCGGNCAGCSGCRKNEEA